MQYTKARNGKKFVITDLGKKQYQVVGKYTDDATEQVKNQYSKCVPSKWLKEGWVIEVDK